MGVPASVSVINFLGSKPSLAAARLRFPAVIVFAFNDPRVEIRAPILIIVPPVMPNIFVAANANGAEELINSFAGTIAAIEILTMRYSAKIVKTDAINTLGIVFCGLITLSAGTVAVSIPTNDHITSVVTVASNEIG